MAYTIKISAQAIDEATGEVVPGHEFSLSIPKQTGDNIETFVAEFAKFGEQMRKKARQLGK